MDQVDYLIQPNQYGFRAGRSIAQPIYILRRLFDMHERVGLPFMIIFSLNWEKAFDKVFQHQLFAAMAPLGVRD